MSLSRKRKQGIVTFLVANCACWKGQEEALNEMEDEVLVGLEADAKTLKANQEAVAAVREQLGLEESVAFNADFVNNEMPAFIKKKVKAKDPEEEEDDEEEEGYMPPKKNQQGEEPIEPLAKRLTPKERAVWNRVVRRDNEIREQVVGRLTEIASAPTTNAKVAGRIKAKLKSNATTEELEEYLDLVGAQQPKQNQDEPDLLLFPDYSGQGGGTVGGTGAAARVDNDALADFADDAFEPTINWDAKPRVEAGRKTVGA